MPAMRAPRPTPETIAIEHVTVLPMTGVGVVNRDRTVIVENGRIARIGPATRLRAPEGAMRVDGHGKFLMPALADMHVHIEAADNARAGGAGAAPVRVSTADVLMPYVANGVLQVFNLSATPDSIRQRDEVESGVVLGPHIALAHLVDGDPPDRPGSHIAPDPTAGIRIVAEVREAGYDALKTYSNLSEETFLAMIAEARRRHLRVIGHIPLRWQDRTEELLVRGFGMIAHSEELGYQAPQVSLDTIPRYVDLLARTGTWLTTTVKLNERVVELTQSSDTLRTRPEMRYVHPYTLARWINQNQYIATRQHLARRQQIVEFNRALIRAIVDADLPFVVGTDSLVTGNVPGFAMHDELVALVAAGAPPALVLHSATRRPAQWLGVLRDRGTVERGKRADLLLLDADPLIDISNTRRIAAVIAGGRYISRQSLDSMMEQLAARYASMRIPDAATTVNGQFEGHND